MTRVMMLYFNGTCMFLLNCTFGSSVEWYDWFHHVNGNSKTDFKHVRLFRSKGKSSIFYRTFFPSIEWQRRKRNLVFEEPCSNRNMFHIHYSFNSLAGENLMRNYTVIKKLSFQTICFALSDRFWFLFNSFIFLQDNPAMSCCIVIIVVQKVLFYCNSHSQVPFSSAHIIHCDF